MYLEEIHLTGTTDGSGDATITGTFPVKGLLYGVQWVDGDLADGVDAVLSVTTTPAGVDTTLLTLTNANDDAWYYPAAAGSDNTGGALTTYRAPVVSGTLKLVISSGGATKTGGAIAYVLI